MYRYNQNPNTTQLSDNREIMTDLIHEDSESYPNDNTVKILKFGTPQTIAIIVLKIEKFDVTLH